MIKVHHLCYNKLLNITNKSQIVLLDQELEDLYQIVVQRLDAKE